MTDIVGKLWGFCHTLRHDGIDYGDYIEPLTYPLFLKMIEEKGAEIPPEYSWSVLREKSGTGLTDMTTLIARAIKAWADTRLLKVNGSLVAEAGKLRYPRATRLKMFTTSMIRRFRSLFARKTWQCGRMLD